LQQPDLITCVTPKTSSERSSSEIFEGEVETCPLAGFPGAADQRATYVRFSAGAHTRVHTHTSDQVLIVVEGRGHVGVPGSDRLIRVGDVVRITAGVAHYHGAGSGEAFAHIALLAGDTHIVDTALSWPPTDAEAPR
jgi:quercetin dioxygenase-like cupin family protein